MTAGPFEQLDYVYSPSRDVAADLKYFETVLGARVVFAIEGMGARVAMLELAAGPPALLLADHLEGEGAVLVFRVPRLREAMRSLEERGWEGGTTLELPMGPACSFTTPGGHRLALYEPSRPGVVGHFEGRRDF